jgi:hypothetical protein
MAYASVAKEASRGQCTHAVRARCCLTWAWVGNDMWGSGRAMEHHVAKVVAAPLGSTETTSEERDQETLKGNMET